MIVYDKKDCVEWDKCRDKAGYGVSWYKGKKVAAHRKAWMINNGDIENGLFVLHKCDNPPCVNVDHLFLGTHTDNMRDRFSKGRARLDGKPLRIGAKVTEKDVIAIRIMASAFTQRQLSEMYGITSSAISRIVTRSNWRNLPL